MKFSIVTPVYNGEAHIAETIESVLSQGGDFEVEYIIQDGGSTDGTLDIVKSYERNLASGVYPIKCANVTLSWHSEKDRGMYDAVNKGFASATGDIFAYINADDYYLPGAFSAIAETFKQFPDIRWLKGVTSFKDAWDSEPRTGECLLYNQSWIRRGIYGRNAYFIHQDSVFWRAGLWREASGADAKLRYAGDYDLWIRFAAHAPLWSLNRPVSTFRSRGGQLSEDMAPYRREQEKISREDGVVTYAAKTFFWLYTIPPLRVVLAWLYPLVFWNRNRYYIGIVDGMPAIKKARTFSIPARP